MKTVIMTGCGDSGRADGRSRRRPVPKGGVTARDARPAPDRAAPGKRFALPALACLLALAAGFPPPAAGADRPLTALVLSGGGARGFAHVGVLSVLEELNVPVDLVVGTSMGAVVGGMHAAGLSSAEIREEIAAIDWDDIFSDRSRPEDLVYREHEVSAGFAAGLEVGYDRGRFLVPGGAIAGQKLASALRKILFPVLDVDDFNRLAIPFRAVATDLVKGETVVLSRGDPARAIMASMAVPAVFSPVPVGERLLVDGGITANLPVGAARAAGAERIIAVDVSSPLRPAEQLVSLFDVSRQVLDIMNRREVEAQRALLGTGDLLLKVGLPEYANTDFRMAPEIIAAGASLALEKAGPLAAFSVSADDYAAARKEVSEWRARQMPPPSFVEIRKPARLDGRVLEARVKTVPGVPVDPGMIAADVGAVYGTGFFDRVDYRFEQRDEKTGLVIEPRAKPWGPNYIYFGLGFGGNFEGDGFFNPLVGYRMTAVNPLGAELNLRARLGQDSDFLSEFYQPLDFSGRFFAAPYLRYRRRPLDVFRDETRVARHLARDTTAGFDLGLNFGSYGRLRFGVAAERTRCSGFIGGDPLSAGTDDDFFLAASLVHDRLDPAPIPRYGRRFDVVASTTRPGRAPGEERREATARAAGAWSRERNTLSASLECSGSFGSRLPGHQLFALGGFQRLSGFHSRRLTGNYAGLGRVSFLREIPRPLLFSRDGYYLGASLEAGGAWERSGDASLDDLRWCGSVFAATGTRFGPFYLGYGFRSPADGIFYFHLGRIY